MRLYVIGPVSGHEGDNREAFEEARRELEAAGFKATIPHDKIAEGTDWQTAMRAGKLVYGGVAELRGVFGSKGARCERGVCEQLGIPHRTVAEWCGL